MTRASPAVSAVGSGPADGPTATPEGLRVAFIGDQGDSSDTLEVLDLVKEEGADFLVIAGDFDYDDSPSTWDNNNVDRLGADYPIFAVIGNHDSSKWSGNSGYQAKLIERMQNAIDDGATCEGEPGRNSACTYKGLFMAMSGVGVKDDKGESADYLREQLAANDAIWSVCVWHRNMTDMQTGSKSNDTGWGVYQACQDEAGIIITGHEHSYARTLTLTEVGNEEAAHGATDDPGLMLVGQGSTFVTVTGVGGRGLRDFDEGKHDDDTWWASIYTSNVYVKNEENMGDFTPESGGVLFIDFNVDGDPYKAHGYFKTIAGEIVDEYDIIREGGSGGGDGDGDGGDSGSGDGDGGGESAGTSDGGTTGGGDGGTTTSGEGGGTTSAGQEGGQEGGQEAGDDGTGGSGESSTGDWGGFPFGDEDAGCSCRTTPSRPLPGALGLLALLCLGRGVGRGRRRAAR
ncbi:metallophosphoesterase [Enhygromyxa salina]|uniref:metallophosphoesterase n=1 Tax=Enhygromyxa salina TaxID=215803 RepID=UPI0015E75C78|nr:metallophosphoesterase [Enhygromyxa salina]